MNRLPRRPPAHRLGGGGLVALGTGLLALAIAAGLASIAVGGNDPSPGYAGSAPWTLASPSGVGLVLTLVPTPAFGSVPLTVNVTATVSGGEAPYDVSVCFATVDHTSPPGACGAPTIWSSGEPPLVFSHSYAAAGNYSILGLATDGQGQSVGSTALVIVGLAPALIVSAVEQSSSGPAPLAVTFNESVRGDVGPIGLRWAYGDGTSSSGTPGIPLTHVYTSPGTYQPVLTATGAGGRETNQDLPLITVAPASHSPQSSTPGGLSIASWGLLAAAFGVAAVGVALVVHVLQSRRWKREGDELVLWLREGDSPKTRTPPSP